MENKFIHVEISLSNHEILELVVDGYGHQLLMNFDKQKFDVISFLVYDQNYDKISNLRVRKNDIVYVNFLD